jgi:hypothetical protein
LLDPCRATGVPIARADFSYLLDAGIRPESNVYSGEQDEVAGSEVILIR